ncbi:MAG: cob(I)yrinic acid a,c-diamide adenosyltransferase [Nitrosopumilus sp.]|uniref:Cob(I)yrinic acid a,c-diamide adenosyltransferase n=2 Tax=Candidatus Nitrosomaritimum aestuariumsis TaxID=3342354 RepID=A0AC60W0K3_9ARCH|nr:cob(I)yrinic acid a,c-diamide adenosyltransferase [Nitrosopumilaceae archaeon]MBA4462515.1 cob(I)yrinic acid a,c-diamide adenosyltransferase [Nitrosopumilaceae archaeon]MBA4463536.1 cob(I)yrinic acid a,c-diamide adenosyltransferase [Nitrosopumilaceae archaeon]NCF22886.1 cob(I)yrinic acid a,c-diamide adenosyltransferase [Nitrosopumilaceae archaeon]
MKIYTKTGDDGTTGLQGDIRISKTHPRIIAYGTIDEANASLGIVLSYDLDSDITNILHKIQNELFIAGADLSNSNLDQTENRVSASMTDSIEQAIDQFEKELSPLTNFILPGGDIAASQIHYTRTVVRRAEIHIVSLKENEKINEDCLKYINRLSDLLFVLGRVINKRKGKQDIIWKP